MESVFLAAFLITFLFCIIKVIEMKYFEKKWKPLKVIIRDAVIVYGCSIVSLFVFFYTKGSITDFLNVVTDNKTLNVATTQIFTDEPGF